MLGYYILLFVSLVFAYVAGVGNGRVPDNRPATDSEGTSILVLIGLALLCAIPVALQLH